MSYSKLESASSRGPLLAALLLLLLSVSACSGSGMFSRLLNNGESADAGSELPATVSPVDERQVVVQAEDQESTPASEARAFLDEATSLIESAEESFEEGDYHTAEFSIKEAHLVLLDADRLVPTRFQLETEIPRAEEDVILHEAMLSFRSEFERLWNSSNALYDRVLPHLQVTVFASNISEEDEEMALEEMNAALEGMDEPAPGSWQEIRDLMIGMQEEGLIDIDMGLESYSDYAWTRIYWCIEYYTGRGRSNFRIWLERSGRYQQLIEEILVEEGLPRDMVYHSMIESGFSPRAYSRAAAVGPWQFMYYTAGVYGLKTYRTDPFLDERRDFRKSSHAASRYLMDLYTEFRDWPLAIAAYNVGEGRVRSARRWAERNRQSGDYWSIYSRLPRETKNHVPYFLAAMVISKNQARFGFTEVAYQTPFDDLYEVVHIPEPHQLSLELAARYAGSTEAMLTELNPELRHKITPPGGYDLKLPKGTTDRFIATLESLPEEGRVSYENHQIRPGDMGAAIAERYGMTWSEIKEHNPGKVRSDTNLQVGTILRIPKYEQSRYLTQREITSLTRQQTVATTGTPVYHTVRRGDTISGLATRYGVTWMQVRQWNNLSSDIIRIGQRLTLYTRASTRTQPAVATANLPASGVYTIGRNDTLWDISMKFNISVANLKRWNNLGSNMIYPGNRLIVTRTAAELAGTAGGDGG
ncbi:LysM peptidoglycan-binding domain-containing protein [Candidatus Zixiibacteriota bacterium]